MNSWGEGVGVVDSELLTESLGNEMGLVTGDLFLSIAFTAEDPAARNDVGIVQGFNEFPGTEFLNLVEFLFDGLLPLIQFGPIDHRFNQRLILGDSRHCLMHSLMEQICFHGIIKLHTARLKSIMPFNNKGRSVLLGGASQLAMSILLGVILRKSSEV